MTNAQQIRVMLLASVGGAIASGVFLGSASQLLAEETEARDVSALTRPSDSIQTFLVKHCQSCHGAKDAEADFRISMLGAAVHSDTAESWLKVAERIGSGEMPPDDQPQPTIADRQEVVRQLAQSLAAHGKTVSSLDGPTGKHLDHDLLFSGKVDQPLNNPPRIWRISPEIYATWVLRQSPKSAKGQALSSPSGVVFRDDALRQTIDEGTLSVLLRNAQQQAAQAVGHSQRQAGIDPSDASKQQDPTALREQAVKAIKFFARYRRFGVENPEQFERWMELYDRAADTGGHEVGLKAVFVAIQLQPESLFRLEFGLGPADDQGRRMLAPTELIYSLSFALGDTLDNTLKSIKPDQLQTREQVSAHVTRMLDRPHTDNTRILRFFQEYFGYTSAPEVFKDAALNPHFYAPALVTDTDQLILVILREDQDVLKQLLTTNRSFIGTRWDFVKNTGTPIYPNTKNYTNYGLSEYPERQPVGLPADQRAGILTQPSWLIAQSGNFDNHPVQRGKWIRERLLGGTIPPVPITVNAQVPDDPTRTLRDRLDEVTEVKFCWQCHERMNPLGLPFEQYDHFGRFRLTDPVVDPTQPPLPPAKRNGQPIPVLRHLDLDTTGHIDRSGEKTLEGPVENPVKMMHRLADSVRVRQVFVRHAFRYWMGRDENLGDAATLRAADAAYVQSGGSMKALIHCLLTSDSFLLRTVPPHQ